MKRTDFIKYVWKKEITIWVSINVLQFVQSARLTPSLYFRNTYMKVNFISWKKNNYLIWKNGCVQSFSRSNRHKLTSPLQPRTASRENESSNILLNVANMVPCTCEISLYGQYKVKKFLISTMKALVRLVRCRPVE